MRRIFINGNTCIHIENDEDEIFVQDDSKDDKKYSGRAIAAAFFLLVPYFGTLIYLVIHCPVAAIIHFLFTLLLFHTVIL